MFRRTSGVMEKVPATEDRPLYDDLRRERESSVVVSRQRLSVASLLGAVSGIALVAVGLVAVLRGGLSGPIDEPVVEVMGLAHTPLLGLVDIGMGLLLLLAAVTSSRGALTLLGSLGVVAGAVFLAETTEVQQRLAAEPGFGWVWIGVGALIALTAWMLPTYDREVRKVRDDIHVV